MQKHINSVICYTKSHNPFFSEFKYVGFNEDQQKFTVPIEQGAGAVRPINRHELIGLVVEYAKNRKVKPKDRAGVLSGLFHSTSDFQIYEVARHIYEITE